MDTARLQQVIEALLFVADKPLTLDQVKEVTGEESKAIKACLDRISKECDANQRGFCLNEMAGGYQFVTRPELSDFLQSYALSKEKRKLSGASLETLSIVAYRQPVTRQEIEYIRGVNVDGAVRTLVEKGLLKIAGRKNVPGRPLLYATTKNFLDHFGLGGLKDLPKLAEFTEKDIQLPDSLKAREAEASAEGAHPETQSAGDPDAETPTPEESEKQVEEKK